MTLHTARLALIKTLERPYFTFRPSLDRHRIVAPAWFRLVDHAEGVKMLDPPTSAHDVSLAIGIDVAGIATEQKTPTFGRLLKFGSNPATRDSSRKPSRVASLQGNATFRPT